MLTPTAPHIYRAVHDHSDIFILTIMCFVHVQHSTAHLWGNHDILMCNFLIIAFGEVNADLDHLYNFKYLLTM